jgi:hypothetical protein
LNKKGVGSMYQKMILSIIATIMIMSCIMAYNITDIQKKTDVLDYTLQDFIDDSTKPQYDNFFLDNQEYVIAYVFDKPMYLLKVDKIDGNYSAKLIVDPTRIEYVINKRYQTYSKQSIDYELPNKLKEDLAVLDASRTFFELKYDALLGLDEKGCSDIEECEQKCSRSKVCDYALKKLGTTLIEDMLYYEQSRRELDSLMQELEELELKKESKEQDLAVLQRYLKLIEDIEKTISNIYSNNIFSQEHILYSGVAEYALDDLLDNKQAIEENLLIGMAEQELVMLEQSILISSSKAGEIIKQKEAEQKRIEEEQKRIEEIKKQQESKPTQKEIEDSSLLEDREAIDSDSDTLQAQYLIPILIAFAVLIAILIWQLWPKISKKRGMEADVKKKEEYSLEDLL